MSEDESSGRALIPKVAANVAATTVGLATSAYAGPVAGAFVTAGLIPVFERIAAYDERAALNAVHAVELGAEAAGLTPEELATWADESPEHLTLLARVVEAAWSFADDAKVLALARVLADSVEDDAVLDLAPLYLSALRDLEPVHVRVLRSMDESVWGKDHPDPDTRNSSMDMLVAEHPTLSAAMGYIVATLDRAGCIALSGTGFGGGPAYWSVTPFGRGCLEYLREADKSCGER